MPDGIAGKRKKFRELIETCLGQFNHREAKIVLHRFIASTCFRIMNQEM